MSEFFLELFSEEIPAGLQKNLREKIFEDFKNLFEEKSIRSKKNFSFSTPNRLVLVFEGLDKQIKIKSKEIRGPKTSASEQALEGFLRSNKIQKKDLFKKKTEKDEFYFYKTVATSLKTHDLLTEFIPKILSNYQWKKSMKWGEFDLNWGRPLKSILSIFDKKILSFKFHHLVSSNQTFLDKNFEEKKRSFENFKKYEKFFEDNGVIINQNKRLKIINKFFLKILGKKGLKINENPKLMDEVVNLVDSPNVLLCKFDKKYLSVPKEILTLTMESHQKYFPTFNDKNEITNEFLIVTNKKDHKGFIKIGNERVIDARLSDAEFFWNKDKTQNLVKKVSELKSMNFFKGLGSYFDKVQRMRKLGGMISDNLMISKEKVELSASVCKVDLISELVGEFPELQGIMGSYFAEVQGFDKNISLAIKEQYLPIGLSSKIPKKPYSIALSLADKIDTLVGFFGINNKPTSSKDPYALRRLALGIIRIIVENKKNFKVKDLINYSSSLYLEQNLKFENNFLQKELIDFLIDRLKFYMKEENIRNDIIIASTNSLNMNQAVQIFGKAKSLNRIINKPTGIDLIASYRRAFNILNNEIKGENFELSNSTDPGIFKTEFEKNLYKKINELKKYFLNVDSYENFDETLTFLAGTKKTIFDFFDNVIVNEKDLVIKKNRLELIQMICKTFDNYMNFSLIDAN
ncbi:glycine--tRNA ligase subunit beta [Candidatus Pelagibacter sp.]|nr:glycine--tRNA ligase subunit beta [Candidatus Pelagibacter sp.]